MRLPCNSAIAFLGINHTETCTQMYTAISFVKAKNWNQPRCPSGGEQLNKLWYIHHGILISNKKAQTADTGNNGDESPENYAE